ncbi:YbaB/EbfC family nucleoid-associated protein [Candidatus Phytoplasma australasiaticum]|uniref:YbaB/EbfC family nucleoid-associated protein n=1 Tax=Candidatus Phytoplasma australasiaticum TaxID=2754999 RepID=UPI0030E9CD8C
MFEKLKRIQESIKYEQKKLESREFTACVGDVMIVMQGTKQVIDVRIRNSQILKNLDLLQESILLSFNNVLQQVDKASRDVITRASEYLEF